MEQLQTGSFCVGILYGAIVAVLVNTVLRELRAARGQMGRKDQKLDSFPVSAQAKMTASGVVSGSQAAAFKYIVLLFALLVVIALSVAGAVLILRI